MTDYRRCVYIVGQAPDEEEIEEMVDDADEDGSGSINFQEFVGLMMKKQQGGTSKEEIKQVSTNSVQFFARCHLERVLK